MGANAQTLIVPGHGTVFTADRSATFPANPLDAFTLTGPEPAGWTNMGHTSKDNTAAFSKDGGDATVLDTWLADSVDTIYAATRFSLAVQGLQVDQNTLDHTFNGFVDDDGGYVIPSSNNGIEKQAVLLATDGTGSLLFWMENTSIAGGDAPSVDAANFFALPMNAQILAADSTKIPAKPDGTPGIMKLYKSGLVASVPVIGTVTPASAAVGSLVTLVGRGFTGVTGAAGVKFGTTNAGASGYSVIDDEHLVATVPAGASGSSPVTVTNSAGTSDAAAFTVNA